MEQISKFPAVSTVCSNCKHCRIVSVDGCFCIFECKCVGTKNPVDGHVTYKECKEARTLINGDWNIDCIWYKQRLSTLQKIKSFFKHPTKFTDSLPEEPKCVYNRTLAERKKYCKFCSVACDERIEEPVSEDLEEAAKKYAMKHGYGSWDSPIKDFKAGAEWQKHQMMKDSVNGIMDCDDDNEWIEITDKLIVTPSRAGKRVKIIIVMEEQK